MATLSSDEVALILKCGGTVIMKWKPRVFIKSVSTSGVTTPFVSRSGT